MSGSDRDRSLPLIVGLVVVVAALIVVATTAGAWWLGDQLRGEASIEPETEEPPPPGPSLAERITRLPEERRAEVEDLMADGMGESAVAFAERSIVVETFLEAALDGRWDDARALATGDLQSSWKDEGLEEEFTALRTRGGAFHAMPVGGPLTIVHSRRTPTVWRVTGGVWLERGALRFEMRLTSTVLGAWRVDAVSVTETPRGPDAPIPEGEATVPTQSGDTDGDAIVRQTCKGCRSVRWGHPGDRWSLALAAARVDCKHVWRRGASRGLRDKVTDRAVILVRRARTFGAFQLFDQTGEPETVSYRWAMRDDGGTSLDADDPAVATGTVEDAKRIQFGPFRIMWSVAGTGRGWLYYDHEVGEEIAWSATRICVSDYADLDAPDPADEEWLYRASLSDEGLRGPDDD